MGRIKLLLPHPEQDVPTEMAGHGRACGGEVTILLKPGQSRGLLVLQVKGEPARVWKASNATDSPQKPTISMSDADAVDEMREVRKVATPLAPKTRKGAWRGYLECDDVGVPQVTLTRKVAPYGTVTLHSTSSGWRWTVDRDPRWFADAKQMKATAGVPHLTEALGEAMDAMMGLVRTACGVRDTTRRESRDEAYAAQREAKAAAKPKKPRAPAKDPIDKLKQRKSVDKAAQKAAAKAAKAAEREAAKAERTAQAEARRSAKASERAAAKAAKTAARASVAAGRRSDKAAEREAAAAQKKAEKAAARAAKAEAAREARRTAREAAPKPKPAKEKPVKEPKTRAAAPAEPAAKPKKKKLTQAEKDAALMEVIAKAMRGIE